METTFTAGQWDAIGHMNKTGYYIESRNGNKVVATIPSIKYGLDNKETEAQKNATLIAAAPELLQALMQFIHSVEHEGVEHGRVIDAVRNAKAAILKATT